MQKSKEMHEAKHLAMETPKAFWWVKANTVMLRDYDEIRHLGAKCSKKRTLQCKQDAARKPRPVISVTKKQPAPGDKARSP